MSTATSTPKKKPGIGKIILIVIGCLVVIGFLANLGKDGSASTASGSSDPAPIAEKETPQIEIVQKTEKAEDLNGEMYRTIHVQVKNNSSALQDYVEIKATWYDKAGKIVGTGMGNTMNLSAGATRVVDVQGINIDNADHYELETSTSPL